MEQNNYHLVSVQSANFRGRKKQPGNLIFDPSTQRLGVFLCYCSNCNSKIIADKQTVLRISKNHIKSSKSFFVRILLGAAKRLES